MNNYGRGYVVSQNKLNIKIASTHANMGGDRGSFIPYTVCAMYVRYVLT